MPTTPPKPPSVAIRLAVILACTLGVSWTCHGILSGRRVSTYTLEESLRLLSQAESDTLQAAACVPVQHHITEALEALRAQGAHGEAAVARIKKKLE